MKIYNIKADVIKGCFVFKYKGYMISASTIADPVSVLVYPEGDNHDSPDNFETWTIPRAMEYVDILEQRDSA